MTRKLALAVFFAALFAVARAPAFAAPEKGAIELAAKAEVEVVKTDASGKKEVKVEDASKAKVVPGTVVLYTITYKNISKKPVEGVLIKDPIPSDTVYVDGSVTGEGMAVTFSVDGGKTFGKAEELFVTDSEGKKRRAVAAEYTDIRWEAAKAVAPGKGGAVSFRAKVK